MRSAGTLLVALPPQCFGNAPQQHDAVELLRNYMPSLVTIERRLRKGVGVDEERVRYARLCRQIEDTALGHAVPAASKEAFGAALGRNDFPTIRVGSEYVDLLAAAHAQGLPLGVMDSARIGATVFPPRSLGGHVRRFKELARRAKVLDTAGVRDRVWFIEQRVMAEGCGLVEVADPLSMALADDRVLTADAPDIRTLWQKLLDLIGWKRKLLMAPQRDLDVRSAYWEPAGDTDWLKYTDQGRGKHMRGRLTAQIEAAMDGGPAINLNSQRHNMLTRQLQKQIHRQPGLLATSATMTYDAGQPARPFPLRCLDHLHDSWKADETLHVGLVSMRHLPIDRYVDINWYRNVDIPSRKGLAGADEACHQASLQQLQRLLDEYRGRTLRVYLYHSGFVPAVVGFYRALVETLAALPPEDAGCLQVVPMLQPRGDEYIEGRPWPS